MERKVFLLGRAKSGTRSIDKALNDLGYSTLNKHQGLDTDNLAQDIIKKMKNKGAFTATVKFDIEQIKEIEKTYPEAVFILTERPSDKWYSSWVGHHSRKATKENPRTEETAFKNKGAWVDKYYIEYNTLVKRHFQGREWKLLHIMYGAKNDNWGALCSFLKKPVPKGGFPHQNRSVDQKKK